MVHSVRATTTRYSTSARRRPPARWAVPTSACIPASSSEERLPLLEGVALGIDKPEDQERARVTKHRPGNEADISCLVAVVQELLSDCGETGVLVVSLVIAQPAIEGA